MIGFTDGTIRPHDPITRAQTITMFFRALPDSVRGQYWYTNNPFADIRTGHWFNNAVSTMYNMGFAEGYLDGTFRPQGNITNAEISALMARFLSLDLEDHPSVFDDIGGHWAEEYINAVAAQGLVDAGGNFNPDTPITRAHTAQMFNRMDGRDPVNAYAFIYEVRQWSDNMDPNAWYFLHIMIASNSFYVIRTEDGREYWISLADDIDWSVLERETSEPWHLLR